MQMRFLGCVTTILSRYPTLNSSQSTSSNPHVAEERGHVDDSGINEEDKYVHSCKTLLLHTDAFVDMVPSYEEPMLMFLLVPGKEEHLLPITERPTFPRLL